MDLSFRPLSSSDFPLLQKWLSNPHVQAWWHEPSDRASIEKKYGPRVDGKEPTHLYVVLHLGRPVGWIQWYRWRDYPKHALQLGATADEAGIDLAIGEKDSLGLGLGPRVINEFVRSVVFSDPSIQAVVTDPEEENVRSTRAFEKAGFLRVHSVRLEGEAVARRVVRFFRRTEIARTERLRIRAWELRDIEAFIALCKQPGMTDFASSTYKELTIVKAQAFIEHEAKRFQSTQTAKFAVYLAESEELLGIAGIFEMDAPYEGCFEINYRFASKSWGNGIGTEAAKAMVKYGFHTLNLQKVFAVILKDNLRSRKVLKNLGMTLEKDLLWHELAAELWSVSRDRARD